MKTITTLIFGFILLGSALSQTVIYMEKEGGVYSVPCKVNGLDLRFIFDTGASTVTISLIEALFMVKNGHLDQDDIIGTSYAKLANGEIAENTRINLREIEIAGLKLRNVKAAIVHELDAPLLLGQTVIEQLGPIQLNGRQLIIMNGNAVSSGERGIPNSHPKNVFPSGYVHCNAYQQTDVNPVTNPLTGQTWMDRNLGAERVAVSIDDYKSFGDLFQWGRFADGHQCRKSSVTDIKATTGLTGRGYSWSGKFILDPYFDGDWSKVKNDDLWSGLYAANNPCPAGYRLPTASEWETELQSWREVNSRGAFSSPLKLPAAGRRRYISGALDYVGSYGNYWSSSVSGSYARYLFFYSGGANLNSYYRAYGYSVRCLKDTL